MDEFPLKVLGRDAAPRQPSASSGDCFDCNICLDFAVDPVVTLCGHLYCWPCIYKWLQMEDRASSPSCPVCKAALSQDSLVPLYGRRTPSPAKRHHQAAAIPHRPPVRHHHHHHHHPQLLPSSLPTQMMSLAAVGLLEEMAVAVLPWAFRNPQTGAAVAEGLYHSRQYQPAGVGVGGRRRRRQEMQVERWLNQIWVFLFCCALLFLLLF